MSDLSIQGDHHHIVSIPDQTSDETDEKDLNKTEQNFKDEVVSGKKDDPSTSVKDPANDSLLLDAPITVGAFTVAVTSANDKSQQQQALNDETNSLVFAKLVQHLIDADVPLQTIFNEIDNAGNNMQSLTSSENSQIATVQTANTTFNSSIASTQSPSGEDQVQISNLNEGIELYNSNSITLSQFNTEYLAPYNTYMESRNSTVQSLADTYNNALSTYYSDQTTTNDAITAQNAINAQFGIPPLALNTQTTPSAATGYPTFPYPATASTIPSPVTSPFPTSDSLVSVTPSPPTTELLTTYYDQIAALYNGTVKTATDTLNNAETIDQYRRYNLRGLNPLGQNTYILHRSKLAPLSTVDAGGGAALAQAGNTQGTTTAQDPNSIEKALLAATDEITQLDSGLPFYRKTAQLTVSLNVRNGIAAATSALRGLGIPITQSTSAFQTATAIGFAGIVATQTASGAIKNAIGQIVQPDLQGKTDQNTIDQVVSALSATVSQRLLKSAALHTSIALGTPGLPGHLFSNTSGISSDDIKKAAAKNQTSQQVLNDPLKQSFTKSALKDSLANSTKLSAERAGDIIVNAYQAALKQGNNQNLENFRTNLTNALFAQGVDKSQASNLAEQAVNITNAQQTAQSLDAALLDKSNSEELLQRQLVSQGISPNKAQHVSETAIQQVIQNSTISTNAEYALALQNALTQLGVNASIAAQASQHLISQAAAAEAAQSALLNPALENVLSPDQLSEELHRHVFGLLKDTAGAENARNIADQAVINLIGYSETSPARTPSVLESLNEQNKILLSQGKTAAQERIAESYYQYIKPTFDLFNFEKRIMDPANTLLMFYGTGNMYADEPIPKNFQRPLDVLV